jgi:hypothetical protein
MWYLYLIFTFMSWGFVPFMCVLCVCMCVCVCVCVCVKWILSPPFAHHPPPTYMLLSSSAYATCKAQQRAERARTTTCGHGVYAAPCACHAAAAAACRFMFFVGYIARMDVLFEASFSPLSSSGEQGVQGRGGEPLSSG